MIQSPPKVVRLVVELHKKTDEGPSQASGFHTRGPPFPYLRAKHLTEPMLPEPDGLVADINATFVVYILVHSKRRGGGQMYGITPVS